MENNDASKEIGLVFNSKQYEQKGLFNSSIKAYLYFLEQESLPYPNLLIDIKDNRTTKEIVGFDHKEFIKHSYTNFELNTPLEDYYLRISDTDWFCYVGIYFNTKYLLEHMPFTKVKEFLKGGIKLFRDLSKAHVHNWELNYLINTTYGDFNFNGRDSSFQGFRWLLYLSNEEVAKNGGEALLKIPHLTHVERLPEGVLFQVGDSPLDALTPSGEEQLYLATKAWCDIVGCSKPLFRLP